MPSSKPKSKGRPSRRRISIPGFAIWGPAVFFSAVATLLLWLAATNHWVKDKKLDSLASNLGSSLFGIAIITCTLEYSAQRRRSKFVEEVVTEFRNASADAMLSQFAPDKGIFREIKETIFNKEYFRTDYRIVMQLTRYPDEAEYLLCKKRILYTIKNISSSDSQDFVIVSVVEKEMEHKFAGSTSINEASYYISESEKSSSGQYVSIWPASGSESSAVTPDDRVLRLEYPVSIPPSCYLHVKICVSSVVPRRDKDAFVSTISSSGMVLEVSEHPDDIDIWAMPLHPSSGRLQEVVRDVHMVRWQIDDGILPGQGLILRWSPISSLPHLQSDA